MNSRALATVEQELLRLPNSMTEIETRYASDKAGGIAQKPSWYVGAAASDVISAALSPGLFVVYTGSRAAAADEVGECALFDKCPPGVKPDGYIEIKKGDFLAVRTLCGDVEFAAATANAEYVVGTDGRPAKVGDSNYPTTVAGPSVVGIGWVTGRIMLGLGSRAAGATLRSRITASSATVSATSFTAFDKTIAVNSSALKSGDELMVKGLAKLTAPDTVTFQLKLTIGGVDFFITRALDPVNAGDQLSFEARILIKTAGASGQILSGGSARVTGDVDGKQSSGGGLFDLTSIDLSPATMTITASGKFSSLSLIHI
jgi:hypothetical protein